MEVSRRKASGLPSAASDASLIAQLKHQLEVERARAQQAEQELQVAAEDRDSALAEAQKLKVAVTHLGKLLLQADKEMMHLTATAEGQKTELLFSQQQQHHLTSQLLEQAEHFDVDNTLVAALQRQYQDLHQRHSILLQQLDEMVERAGQVLELLGESVPDSVRAGQLPADCLSGMYHTADLLRTLVALVALGASSQTAKAQASREFTAAAIAAAAAAAGAASSTAGGLIKSSHSGAGSVAESTSFSFGSRRKPSSWRVLAAHEALEGVLKVSDSRMSTSSVSRRTATMSAQGDAAVAAALGPAAAGRAVLGGGMMLHSFDETAGGSVHYAKAAGLSSAGSACHSIRAPGSRAGPALVFSTGSERLGTDSTHSKDFVSTWRSHGSRLVVIAAVAAATLLSLNCISVWLLLGRYLQPTGSS